MLVLEGCMGIHRAHMQVYKAYQDGVRLVAVKVSTTDDRLGKHIEGFWREIELIASCRDRNILQFYGAAVNGVC